jgi:hypothetical protein
VSEGARIRYFCQVSETADREYAYLEALMQTGLGVRILPIGFIMFDMPEDQPGWARWKAMQKLFTDPIANRYVNIVCAPPGLMMGQPLQASQRSGLMVTPRGDLPTKAPGDDSFTAYTPGTALIQLYTLGVPNVAITGMWPEPPGKEETRVLRRYDAVITDSATESAQLSLRGIDAIHLPPEPDQLSRLLQDLL